jgi:hypothetical protein
LLLPVGFSSVDSYAQTAGGCVGDYRATAW